MVAKKHKSKRMSCSMRYKIQKKVKDSHRKAKKLAGKNPQWKGAKKDPGIPSMWPMKEELLHEIEEKKLKVAGERERQKEQRNALIAKNRSMTDFAANAAKRADEFESTHVSSSGVDTYGMMGDSAVNGGRDNSMRAYYQEFQKVVKNSDVILEVLDARDPLGCRTKKIEEMILAIGNKRVILVLNKIDLVPRENADAWLKHLRNEFPTVAFKASTQQQSRLSQATVNVKNASQKLINSSECLGADDLMSILKNYCRNMNIKTAITVGVIGYPNTGKSSLINSLKRAKVCSVGSVPGHTKHAQEIFLDKTIKLLDCPGIVFSLGGDDSPNAVLRNCIKVELLEDPVTPVEGIISRCEKHQLLKVYGIPAFRDVNDFLLQLARQMGRLKKGGIADIEGTARCVIRDWNSGKISYCTSPPKKQPVMSSQVVTEWANEFSLDDIKSSQELALQTVPLVSEYGAKFMRVQSHENVVDMDMELADSLKAPENSDDEQEQDEEEEEEIDAMSDGEESAPVLTAFAARPKPRKSAVDAEEAALNPRAGNDLKKFLKKQKKNKRKMEKAQADAMNDGEEYNFADF